MPVGGGLGSAAQHCGVSKTRVNALVVLRCAQETQPGNAARKRSHAVARAQRKTPAVEPPGVLDFKS